MGDGDSTARSSRARRGPPRSRRACPELRERMPELKERRSGRELEELRAEGLELRAAAQELARQYAKMDVSWARCGYARIAREVLLSGILGPMIDLYVRAARSAGEARRPRLERPVIFVANHSSHLDTPTILRAIPRKWRTARRSPPPPTTSTTGAGRPTASRCCSTRSRSAARRRARQGATDHVDKLIGEGWNLLMFPEGTRSRDGQIGKVRSGAAVIAAHHGVDIVPIYVGGTHEAMPPGQNWPKRGPGRLFAPPQGRGPLRRADPAARPGARARRWRGARLLGARGPAEGSRRRRARRAAHPQRAAGARGGSRRRRRAASTRSGRPLEPSA